jgi:FKBP-type peptidyl-prolyl cis-trans isomerase 2
MAESGSNEKKILGIVIIALLAIAGYVGYATFFSDPTVGHNDVVEINYIAWLEDGTVFATTIVNEYDITPDTILDRTHRYRPIAVTIGPSAPSTGTIDPIEGLEQGLMGMKEGEVKIITVPPELGYQPDEELISTVNRAFGTFDKEQTTERDYVFDRLVTVSLAQYQQAYGTDAPEVGDVVSMVDWDGTVTEVTETSVTIRGDPEIGDVMDTKPWGWEVTEITEESIITKAVVEVAGVYENAYGTIEVTDFDDETVYFTQLTLNETYATAYGAADIIDNGDTFTIFLNPEEGTEIETSSGSTGIIRNVTDTTFDLDFNPVYVGTTITYKVIVETIIKAE